MIIFDIVRIVGIIINYPYKWLFFKSKVYYENDDIPRFVKGGALVISNHFSVVDYLMNVHVFFPRKLYVVASEHAYRNRFIRFGMKFWGGIPVNRVNGGMSFVPRSVREIKKGHLVQIFPEGHNTDDGTIKPFFPSYLMIAHRAGAPIIPVVTDGNYGAFKKAHLIVGERIILSDYCTAERLKREDYDRLNEIVFQRVLALRAELDSRIEAEKKRRKNR